MNYENVRVGAYVWISRGKRMPRRLVRVTSLTPKQIKTDGGGNIYKKQNGGGVGSTTAIVGVASAEEIIIWQTTKKLESEESAKQTAAQEKENAWRKEAVAPIPFSSSVVTGHDGKLSLELYGLDREDVEQIVKILSEGRKP